MEAERIRNVAVIGHAGSGKTSLAEALLFHYGVTTRLGKVDDGSATLDYYDEERERKTTFTLKVCAFDAKESGLRIHLLDTPGYLDFSAEAVWALSAADNAIVAVNAETGVEVGTEVYWEYAERRKLPRLIVVTHCGTEKAKERLADLREYFGNRVCPIQVASGLGAAFKEVKYVWGAGSTAPEYEALLEALSDFSDEFAERYLRGESFTDDEIKATLKRGFKEARVFPVIMVDAMTGAGVGALARLIEAVLVSPNEARSPICVEGEARGLKASPTAPFVGRVFKIISEPHIGEIYYVRNYAGELACGKETANTTRGGSEKVTQIYRVFGKERVEVPSLGFGGIGALVKLRNTLSGDTLTAKGETCKLDAIEVPKPSIYEAVVPRSRGDEQRFSEALTKLQIEDPSFHFNYEPELKQHIIYGLGDQHLAIIQAKMKKKFNVEVELQKPRVPYRETPRKKSEAIGRYVKQSGGRGQYGVAHIRVEPLKDGQEYEFENAIFGGAIPGTFIPSVETGVKKAMGKGVLAGCPVVNVKVTLFDGKYHPVDSSNIAFEIAGSMGFKAAEEAADPYLLEPIYKVVVSVPEENMGDIIGDLNAKRAKILGMESEGRKATVTALVPLAEMYRYANTLKSITRGRGTFQMEYSHYEEVPRENSERLVPELRKERGVQTGDEDSR
jgi:elongation factor G